MIDLKDLEIIELKKIIESQLNTMNRLDKLVDDLVRELDFIKGKR